MWAQPSPPIVGEGAGVGSVLLHCHYISAAYPTPIPSPHRGGECLRSPSYQAFFPSIVPTGSNLSGIYPIINTQSMCMWAQPSPPIVGEGAGVGSVLFHLCIVITSPRLTPPPSPPLIGAGSAYGVAPIWHLTGSAYGSYLSGIHPNHSAYGVQPIRHSSHPLGGKRGYLFFNTCPRAVCPVGCPACHLSPHRRRRCAGGRVACH